MATRTMRRRLAARPTQSRSLRFFPGHRDCPAQPSLIGTSLPSAPACRLDAFTGTADNSFLNYCRSPCHFVRGLTRYDLSVNGIMHIWSDLLRRSPRPGRFASVPLGTMPMVLRERTARLRAPPSFRGIGCAATESQQIVPRSQGGRSTRTSLKYRRGVCLTNRWTFL